MPLYRASSRPEMSTTLPTSSTMKRSGSLRFDTGRLRRNIQKQFTRTREKMRHGGEKADRNEDDFIKKCEIIIAKKQASTVKLQTELKRHLKALKSEMESTTVPFAVSSLWLLSSAADVTSSSRSLYETILEGYEDSWSGRKEFNEAFLCFDSYWPAYHTNLCTVMEHVTIKLAEFAALKDKLEKRKRKLMDFKIVERNLREAMSTKRKDPTKLQKAEREVEIMRRAFDEVNNEVSHDLPKFYDDHVHFCCENWSFLLENEKNMYDSLCSTIDTFMASICQLRLGYQQQLYQLSGADVNYSEISRSTLSLHYPNHSGSYNDLYEPLGPRTRAESGPVFPETSNRRVSRHASSASARPPPKLPSPLVSKSAPGNRSQSMDDMLNADDDSDGYGTIDFSASDHRDSSHRPNGTATLPRPSGLSNGPGRVPTIARPPENDSDGEDHVYAQPDRSKKAAQQSQFRRDGGGSSASERSSSLSSNHRSTGKRSNTSSIPDERPLPRSKENLAMMIAVHSYERQNDDELDLSPNDLVQVLPWEDESLKEDGWLFGMKLPDGSKGLFPENHTENYNHGT